MAVGKSGKTAIRGAITVQCIYVRGQVGFICNHVSTQWLLDVLSVVA